MPERIKGSARKSKATASRTKARKATARDMLSVNTGVPNTNPKDSQDEDTENDKPKTAPGASGRFAKTNASSADQQWQKGKKARRRAERNAEQKKAKREKKIREEAERAQARAKAQAQAHAWCPAPQAPHTPRTHSQKQRYAAWSSSCAIFFASPDAPAEMFPIPQDFKPCDAKVCVKGDKLGFCHHQLKALLMGSGELNVGWLKKERLRWHPDKFPGREEVSSLAQEMFQMLQRLIDGDRPRGGQG